MSTLSSCRTEDGAITQKQVEDKRFAVFVPESGKTVNYATGFAFLMQRYDNLHKTNLSGINNNKPIIGNLNTSASINQNASITQGNEAYVEFGVHTKTFTEENGDKWVIYPKVQGNKVIGLIIGALTKSETYVSYHAINPQIDFYKDNIMLFQEALDIYLNQRSRLFLNAGIKPMAEGGQKCTNDGSAFDCNIDGVTINKDLSPPPLSLMTNGSSDPSNSSNGGGGSGGGGGSNGGSGTGGQCPDYLQCIPTNPDGGLGGDNTLVSPNFRMKLSDQQKYPRFTNMVKNLEQFVRNNPVVLNALVKNTGLTEAKVLEGLKWGKGPLIDFDEFPSTKYCEYSDFSKRLIINAVYVRGLENSSLAITQKNTSFLLAITVLHEYTHYGDKLADGYYGDYEMGFGFEQDILGKAKLSVTKENAHIYVKMFNF